MRRTDQEFKEEILRRCSVYRQKQRRKRKQALTASLCIFMCVTGLYLFWPTVFSAKSADNAAPESMQMAPGGEEQILLDSEIGAEEPAEAMPEEGNLYGDNDAKGSISRIYDVVRVEVSTNPESQNWVFTDEEEIVKIIIAIENFHSADSPAEMMESVGDAEGLSYEIVIVHEKKTEFYTLFNNGLFSEAEGGWIGVDAQLYQTLEALITQE